MTREVIDNGVLRAVENIQLFLDGRARDLVVPPPATTRSDGPTVAQEAS